MWGVYPKAMACNVGVLSSDINLVERFLRKSPNSLIPMCTLILGRRGLYLKIGSPKLISEHNTTLQVIAFG